MPEYHLNVSQPLYPTTDNTSLSFGFYYYYNDSASAENVGRTIGGSTMYKYINDAYSSKLFLIPCNASISGGSYTWFLGGFNVSFIYMACYGQSFNAPTFSSFNNSIFEITSSQYWSDLLVSNYWGAQTNSSNVSVSYNVCALGTLYTGKFKFKKNNTILYIDPYINPRFLDKTQELKIKYTDTGETVIMPNKIDLNREFFFDIDPNKLPKKIIWKVIFKP